jgi:hypothetical protein
MQQHGRIRVGSHLAHLRGNVAHSLAAANHQTNAGKWIVSEHTCR